MIDDIRKDGEQKLQQRGVASKLTGMPGNSVRITREYLDSLLVELRTIGAAEANTKMELFGQTFSTPVMVAAISGLDNICPNGMVEVARGAAAANAVMWAGIGDEQELRAMIGAGAKVIKIVKPYADEALIFEKLAQAEQYGTLAVGMDTDFFFGSSRHPRLAQAYLVSPKTLPQLKSYVAATKLPFVFKGVLSVRDAELAMQAGAAGIVVSHHGGSVTEFAVPPLRILPHIVKAVGGNIPVFVDCGISGGYDAFKALALGAKGVCMGRTVMAGLASEGAEGVRKVLEAATTELQRVMSLTGSANCNSIDPDVIWR